VSCIPFLPSLLTLSEGVGSWEDSAVIPNAKFLYWLVSQATRNIWGFIVHGTALLSSFLTRCADLNSSSYLIYLIEESSARRLSPGAATFVTYRSLSTNAISIPANSTFSARNLRSYVPGISDQHLYILGTGIN
jgi:hypothetical protein